MSTMPTIAAMATPAGNYLAESTIRDLFDAVTDTFGNDAPAECYTIALEMWDDAYYYAVQRGRVNRWDVTSDAIQTIRDSGLDSDDDDDTECEGHESLDGAHMGESVFCDGSCR